MNKDNEAINKVSMFSNQAYLLILERDKTIILVVQLFISLLVVASFSEKIIPSSSIPAMKLIIVFLLYLIPVMVWDYILKINDGINSVEKALVEIIVGTPNGNKNNKWYLIPFKLSTYYYITALTFAVDMICKIFINSTILFLLGCLIQMILIAFVIFSKRSFGEKTFTPDPSVLSPKQKTKLNSF